MYYEYQDQTNNYSTVDAARATLHVCRDNPVVNAFFSEQNIQRVQTMMRTRIREQHNITIDPQSKTELMLVMSGIFNMHQGNVVAGANVDCQVRRLNELVVDYCVENILVNIRHYMGYLRDSSKPYTLLDRPVNTSLKGERTLSWQP